MPASLILLSLCVHCAVTGTVHNGGMLLQHVVRRHVTLHVANESGVPAAALSHGDPSTAEQRQDWTPAMHAAANQKIPAVRPAASQRLWLREHTVLNRNRLNIWVCVWQYSRQCNYARLARTLNFIVIFTLLVFFAFCYRYESKCDPYLASEWAVILPSTDSVSVWVSICCRTLVDVPTNRERVAVFTLCRHRSSSCIMRCAPVKEHVGTATCAVVWFSCTIRFAVNNCTVVIQLHGH